MNAKKAARDMERLIRERERHLALPNEDYEMGINHLKYMCRHIYNGFVTGQKAVLWLGYIQGVMRACGGASMDELKKIIEDASEKDLTYPTDPPA